MLQVDLEEMLPDDVTKDQKEELSVLLGAYADIIPSDDRDLGHATVLIRHYTETGDAAPIHLSLTGMHTLGSYV